MRARRAVLTSATFSAVICGLATAMGHDWGEPTAEEVWDELRSVSLNWHHGMSYARLDALGGLQWPCPSEDHPGTPLMHERLWSDDPAELAMALTRIADDWSAFRNHACGLAPMAAQRFAPERYRREMAGAIAAARPSSGVDILMGIGGTPEGIIAASALACMGGELQARLWPTGDEEREKVVKFFGKNPEGFSDEEGM